MAQLNCPSCYNGMFVDQWGNLCQDPNQRTGSNVSLNMPVPPGYPMQMNPLWMNMNPMGTWHGPPPNMMGMFPFTNMQSMNMGTPTNQSSDSRSHSRAASPTPSIKSRKSHISRSNNKNYRDDSDEDRNSVFSYADKSERKSVRDRAERIKARKEREARAKSKERSTPPRRDDIDDRIERMSIRSRRDSEDIKIEKERMKEELLERMSIRSRRNSESYKEKESPPSRRSNDRPTQIKHKNLSSESDDYKSDSQKESEVESKSDSKESEISSEVLVAEKPNPPSLPSQDWECEHCTFVNPAGIRVCTICCKTPTQKVKVIQTQIQKPPTHETSKPNKVGNNNNKVSSGTNTQTKSAFNPIKINNSNKKSTGTGTNWSGEEPVLNHINAAYEGINTKTTTNDAQKKGRTLRKITFWPGTKFSPFYK